MYVCACVLFVLCCAVLLPGWYATAMTGSMITATAACPQGYYCPGGAAQQVFDASNPSGLSPAEPSIKACLAGMWTPDVAATSQEQCCEYDTSV